MRRALLALVLLLGASVAGGLGAASPHRDDPVRVEGTVTGVDGTPAGDAVVLVGDDATLTKLSPDELRDVAADDPPDLTVVTVDDDGRFETVVTRRRADAAVAVSGARISDLVHLRGENATVSLRLYGQRPQTVHAHVGAVAYDERRADLFVSLVNSGDAAIENLSVRVAALPAGWSVAAAETDGRYHPADRTLAWSSVGAGEEVGTTLVLSVPENASPGPYTVELRAGSDTHRVDVADETETVEVLPEDTPGPTTTARYVGTRTTAGGGEPTPTRTTETAAPPSTDTSVPGLGAGASIAALALLVALLVRHRERGG